MVLEKTLDSPLDCKEIQPVHSEGDQSWVFTGRTDVEAETPILWPPNAKRWLIWKDPDAGKDWRQEEKQTTEDEMVGWHHWLNGHGFGWTPGVGDGQWGLVCCSSWGHKELDTTEWLNWRCFYQSVAFQLPNFTASSIFFTCTVQIYKKKILYDNLGRLWRGIKINVSFTHSSLHRSLLYNNLRVCSCSINNNY